MKVSKAEKAEARETMLAMLNPGDTVYTIVERVSKSGMSRVIRVVVMKTDDKGQPYALHPNYSISKLLGLRRPERCEGMRIDGCGSDMGFEIVYALGKALWPDGTPTPHGTRNGEPDSDGGYALKHRWL